MRYTAAFVLLATFPAAAQKIDWPKVNDEAMRNYQSLVQIDSTTSEAGVMAPAISLSRTAGS